MSDYFPDLPYIVIDQNKCRDKTFVESLFRMCKIQGLKLLLPDTAVYEFSKGKRPFETWRRSLEHLCDEPGFVVAGRSVGLMMTEEVTTGQLVEDVVDHEVTPKLQLLLSELKTGDDTRVNSSLAEVAKIIDAEKQLREQHVTNKRIVSDLADQWKSDLDEATLRRLRNKEAGVFAGIISQLETAKMVFQAAVKDGCDKTRAVAITSGPSIYGHTVYALAALALDWLVEGGIVSLDPEKVTNDFHDLDYVVTASYCRHLETDDKRAKRVHEALREGLEQRLKTLREIAHQRTEAQDTDKE